MGQTVQITVSGGVVQHVEAPPGIMVVVRDYDVDERDCEGIDIRRDENNDLYQRMQFGAICDGKTSDAGIVSVDLSGVDWIMLRKQKEALVALSLFTLKACSILGIVNGGESAIEGVLGLLDHVQDQAVEILGEEAVFGKTPGQGEADQ